MYWHQGFDKANEIIRQCVNSWEHHNPDWRVILLDKNNVEGYIGQIDIPESKFLMLRVQHQSDLIRTRLLIQYGGVWVDPTCFCMKPLDSWLPEYLTAGLFLFQKPGRDRIISNWFIAASEKNNPLLQKLYDLLCQYWTTNDFRNLKGQFPRLENLLVRIINRNTFFPKVWTTWFFTKVIRLYPYMIYHYQFCRLVTRDKECKSIWNRMPAFSALAPLRLQREGPLGQLDPRVKSMIDSENVPLHKLRWQMDASTMDKGSILNYLFCSIE